MSRTAHIDRFVLDRLPPPEQLPEFVFDLPQLDYPARLNCAVELLDNMVAAGNGERRCIVAPGVQWTYRDLLEQSNRIAQVLVKDLGLVPGNRVLLRSANNPMMAACWFGVMKAGGVAVATMPLLRARELTDVIVKAEISHALCDARLADELCAALPACPSLQQIAWFNGNGPDGSASLERCMAQRPAHFDNVDTAADDPCLIAFTSGTTGKPKGTVHFHRDVLAICDCWPPSVLRAGPEDLFTGSPPLAFTFGLGGLLLFPMRVGAASLLLEKVSPDKLLPAIAEHGATVCFTTPTAYRGMAPKVREYDLSRLRKCVSAGEALPDATRHLWREVTGIELIDGIGSTEMLHIFISADEQQFRPGATGKVVPGYRACIMDKAGQPMPRGVAGRLAVKGPTGCRYLADERQKNTVQNGWNLTGDIYVMDADGYFFCQGRGDDMIVSSGYNISAPEVESALLEHPLVAECAVIGVADSERGQIVKAFVVLRDGREGSEPLAAELQEFVKKQIAPYKYPRAVAFRSSLPRTETGKLQRFRLREERET